MKKAIYFVVLFAMVFQPGLGLFESDTTQAAALNAEVQAGIGSVDQPGWPLPAKPVPHHEPGQISNALTYTSQVDVLDESGALQPMTVEGLDAMAVDGVDPMAGNYTLAGMDQLLRSSIRPDGAGETYGMETFSVSGKTGDALGTFTSLPGSQNKIGYIWENDIAAGDLNNDGQAEQVAAWLDLNSPKTLNLSAGKIPGTLGKTTSAPAAVARSGTSPAEIDLLVRGADYGLWHCKYVSGSGCSQWDNDGGGGKLLSGPAAVSKGANAFDVYAILADSRVGRRSWNAGVWSTHWEIVDPLTTPVESPLPVPELAAPAVVDTGTTIDLFRLGSDNTLQQCHFSGTACTWTSLGGMLASGPAAVQVGTTGIQVFARGFDDALWTRTYAGSAWQAWQRLVLGGLPEGVTLASAPAAVSLAAGQIDVYVRGSDSQLWTAHFNGSAWGAWSGKGGTLASAAGVALAGGPYVFSRAVSGGLQVFTPASAWVSLEAAKVPAPTQVDTGLEGIAKGAGVVKDYSVDVETGYFWGDGRSQVVVGYFFPAGTVQIALFDISDSPDDKGFTLQKVASLQLTHNVDYFAITTGDFLKDDGNDDIAVSYINGTTINVDFLSVNPLTRELELKTVTSTPDDKYGWTFSGTHEAVSGDFDQDGMEELAVNTTWSKNSTYSWWYLGTIECKYDTFRFAINTYIYDLKYTTSQPQLTRYLLGTDWEAEGYRNAETYSVATSIAAGDVNGDQKDEIVRTTPGKFGSRTEWCWTDQFHLSLTSSYGRGAEVVDLVKHPGGEGWSADSGGVIDENQRTLTGFFGYEYTANSYGDRLAVGDIDRDLTGEIILQEGKGDYTQSLNAYKVKPLQLPVTYEQIAAYNLPTWGNLTHLVVGNLTGKGIRLGQPTYRKENRVDSLLALLNMPPKHRDLIDVNGQNQLIEMYTASYAQHSAKSGAISTTKTSAIRDYGLSTEISGEGDVLGASIKASVKYTYGDNFELSTNKITTRDFTDTAKADSHDQIIAYGAPYQVWEYPVLNPDTGAVLGYMSVVFPLVANNVTPSASPQYGDLCTQNLTSPYSPGHQLYNIWSYDPSGPVLAEDYDPNDSSKVVFRPAGGSNGNYTFEITNSYFESTTQTSKISHKIEGSLEVGGKIPLVGDVKVTTSGNYSTEQIQTDEVSTSSSTTIIASMSDEDTADAVTIYPILYWSKTGYMVLDYQVEPTDGDTWKLYNKPDPAFILPWYGTIAGDAVSGYRIQQTCSDRQLLSPDVVISPANASVGDEVTISATVRNFSNIAPVGPVKVRFYLGEPSKGVIIGEDILNDTPQNALTRDSRQTASITWTVSGSGKQKIYAVIDPADAANPSGLIHEMHDIHDLINNNTAFNYLQIGVAEYFDMGLKEVQAYQDQAYTQKTGLQISFYLPPGNLAQDTRFDMVDSNTYLYRVLGNPFSLVASQGLNPQERAEIVGLNLKPGSSQPPAILSLVYGDILPVGTLESSLNLYRLGPGGWVDASCGTVERFPEDNRIAVPVCSTGTFALSAGTPVAPKYLHVPIIKK